jgi:hypothetical protein
MPHGIPHIPTATPAPPTPAPGSVWLMNGQIVIYSGSQWIPLGNVPEDEPMAEFRVTHKAYHVNSKRLLNRIVAQVCEVSQEFVFQRSSSLSKTYDFSQLIEYLDLFMHELCDDKQIVVFEVVGDHRNNNHNDVYKGKICVELSYQQFNCLNMTKIVFFVEKV